MKARNHQLVAFLAIALLAAPALRAATPDLQVILPRGVQRGTEVDLDLRGARLGDAQDVLFFSPGITVKSVKVVNPQQVTVHVEVAKDAPVGEMCSRVRTASGISDLRTLYVGPFKVVPEKQGNIDLEHAQPVEMNTTIAGVVQS